eukprot:NODE_21080_length_770_cov_1.057543.p1 GENE.NODE_21080_length_770_cov_1.057543~~NODE_21080_length_770_cov_1.057543.p1  ORF type:complete len:154 (+),score=56.83 NODE_21080_length_770_cov_1.057543:187-648(+)
MGVAEQEKAWAALAAAIDDIRVESTLYAGALRRRLAAFLAIARSAEAAGLFVIGKRACTISDACCLFTHYLACPDEGVVAAACAVLPSLVRLLPRLDGVGPPPVARHVFASLLGQLASTSSAVVEARETAFAWFLIFDPVQKKKKKKKKKKKN